LVLVEIADAALPQEATLKDKFVVLFGNGLRTIPAMLLHLFQAAQATMSAPHAQPNVIYVQQAPGETPEWVKTLIRAAVGGFVAIATNTAMELIKSKMTKSDALKELRGLLIPELKENLNQVETLRRMTDRASEGGKDDRAMTLSLARDILRNVSNDRFTDNFDGKKALVYKVDPQKTLAGFYTSMLSARRAADNLDYGSLLHNIRRASEQGRGYLSEHRVEYAPIPDSFYDPLVQPPAVKDNPESWLHEITKTGAFAPKGSG
jgi:hypothetical protein